MDLSYILSDTVEEPISKAEIKSICYDLQKYNNEDLIFLLDQRAIDTYLANPVKVSAIVTKIPFISPVGTKTYTAKNIRRALSLACARLYAGDMSKIKFVGITGTNGKSTTAIILEKILVNNGYKVGLIGTGKIKVGEKMLTPKYYSMTTPSPDLLYSSIGIMKEMGVEIIVMEVSSHALDQERVCGINFDIGIFTNLSEEHLDYHKSMEEYFFAKEKLFSNSKLIIANGDDRYGKEILRNHKNADNCGKDPDSNISITLQNDFGFLGSQFIYNSDFEDINIHITLPGAYNIYNAALAMRAAELLGITKENIKKNIEQIDKVDGRFNVINDKVTVIIDYAHTISAFDNLLKSLNCYKNDGQKLILVFGCGGDRDKSKRGAMGIISEKYADKIIITSDNPRSEDPVRIIDDITKPMGKKAEKILNRKEAIRHAILTSRDGDIIAIVGKGPEKYTIVNGAYSEFDEEKIVRATLMERNK